MNHTIRRFFRSALLLAIGLSSAACTPYATFPSDGGAKLLGPGVYPAPQLMGKGLKVTYEKTVGDLPLVPAAVKGDAATPPALVYDLPAGVSAGNWTQIGNQTEISSAREVTRADVANGTPIWAVKQIRIRSNRAEVDVIYPGSGGLYQLATAIFRSEPFGAFKLQSFQRWLIPEDAPVCNHPAEIADAKAEEKAAADAEAAENAAAE